MKSLLVLKLKKKFFGAKNIFFSNVFFAGVFQIIPTQNVTNKKASGYNQHADFSCAYHGFPASQSSELCAC